MIYPHRSVTQTRLTGEAKYDRGLLSSVEHMKRSELTGIHGAPHSDILICMSDQALLREQLAYYRRRAPEYDVTAFGDVEAARRHIAGVVDGLDPRGDVLEIACGTGMWTAELARRADSVLAVDAAPEMIDIARERVRPHRVDFVAADVFAWRPARRFDTIFFACWLSHVPPSMFDGFWAALGGWLNPDGRVIFVDEHVDESPKEAYVGDTGHVVERRLLDGSAHRLVKVFVDPATTRERLARLGWRARLWLDTSGWVIGEAVPDRGRASLRPDNPAAQ